MDFGHSVELRMKNKYYYYNITLIFLQKIIYFSEKKNNYVIYQIQTVVCGSTKNESLTTSRAIMFGIRSNIFLS